MSTKARWTSGVLTYYESTTGESEPAGGQCCYYDDFLGPGSLVIPATSSPESGCDWTKTVVSANATAAGVQDQAGGVIACALAANSEEEEAIVHWDNHRGIDVSKSAIFEARIKLSVLPTGNGEIVIGLAGDYAKGPDNPTYSAFFTADGSGELFCECDDNATDSSVTSGVTLTNADWAVLRIDFSDVTKVRYYVNGAEVASASTIPYAATGANAILQPYIGVYKASGTGVGTVQVDYVRIWQKRA